MMSSGPGRDRPADRQGHVLRPEMWRPADRHILIGVSHASDNPARHRNFEIRASFDPAAGGWVARVREQNLNEQAGAWTLVDPGDDASSGFPSAATCLGHAVTTLVAEVDQEAGTRC